MYNSILSFFRGNITTFDKIIPYGVDYRGLIDKFFDSEFFFRNGRELIDVQVYDLASVDTEVRKKILDTMVENRVSELRDSGISNEDIFKELDSGIYTIQDAINQVQARITQINQEKTSPTGD